MTGFGLGLLGTLIWACLPLWSGRVLIVGMRTFRITVRVKLARSFRRIASISA